MKRIIATTIVLVVSVLFAAAQPAKEPYAPGLGEFMTATQLRHAKLWFAGKMNNWDLAAYEIDQIKEGLEDAQKQCALRHRPLCQPSTVAASGRTPGRSAASIGGERQPGQRHQRREPGRPTWRCRNLLLLSSA